MLILNLIEQFGRLSHAEHYVCIPSLLSWKKNIQCKYIKQNLK